MTEQVSGDVGAEVAAVLAAHVRGDWSDRTYTCQGCVQRFEADAQAGFDAQAEKPTRDQMLAFRNDYAKVSHPGWSLADYNAHVADALAPLIAVRVEAAKAEALREAASALLTTRRDAAQYDYGRWFNAGANWLSRRAAALDPGPRP